MGVASIGGKMGSSSVCPYICHEDNDVEEGARGRCSPPKVGKYRGSKRPL